MKNGWTLPFIVAHCVVLDQNLINLKVANVSTRSGWNVRSRSWMPLPWLAFRCLVNGVMVWVRPAFYTETDGNYGTNMAWNWHYLDRVIYKCTLLDIIKQDCVSTKDVFMALQITNPFRRMRNLQIAQQAYSCRNGRNGYLLNILYWK